MGIEPCVERDRWGGMKLTELCCVAGAERQRRRFFKKKEGGVKRDLGRDV